MKDNVKKLFKMVTAVSLLYDIVDLSRLVANCDGKFKEFAEKSLIDINGYGEPLYKYRDVRVYYNPVSMYLLKRLGSIALTLQSNSGPIILVGPEFMEFTDATKEFVLLHEAGHIDLDHLQKVAQEGGVNRTLETLKGCVSKFEVEADAFAVKHTSRQQGVFALYEVSRKLHGVARKEVMERIKIISKGEA